MRIGIRVLSLVLVIMVLATFAERFARVGNMSIELSNDIILIIYFYGSLNLFHLRSNGRKTVLAAAVISMALVIATGISAHVNEAHFF